MRSTLRRLLSSLAIATLSAAVLVSPATAEPEPDTTPPVLTSISVDPGPYDAYHDIYFHLEASDASPIRSVTIKHQHVDPAMRATPLEAWFSSDDLDVTQLRWYPSWGGTQAPLDGPYTGTAVFLEDQFHNWAMYQADGTLRTSGGYVGRHDVDISAMIIAAAGRDITPPVLNAIRGPEQVVAEYGNSMAPFSYDVTDPRIDSIQVIGTVNNGPQVLLGSEGGLRGRQQGSISFQSRTVGEARVTQVVLGDSYGNRSTYWADGRVENMPGLRLPRTFGSHTVDLASIVVPIVPPTIVGLNAVASNGAATIAWSQPAINLYRVTVQPGNKVVNGSIDTMATYQRSVPLSGLTNGTEYTATVTQLTQQGVVVDSATVKVTPRMGAMRVFGAGDRSKDGRADLWAAPTTTDPNSTATWRLYKGAGAGKFAGTVATQIPATKTPFPGATTTRGPGASLGALYLSGADLIEPTATGTKVVGKGFNIFRTIDASSDLTGDGIADLIGITPAGEFYVYPSTSTGAIGRGVRLGSGWGGFQSIFSPGDFNGDTRSDVIGVDGLGKLWLYPGTGRAGFGARVLIGSGWAAFGSVFPMRDFSGDGKVDLGAITSTGALRMYPGNGRGGFLTSSQIGTGWSAFL